MSNNKPAPIDKFEEVTNRIIALLESGTKPWVKPWSVESGGFRNALSGHVYSGCNPLICAIDSMLFGYQSQQFIGAAQAKQQGWKIRKGSKSTWLLWAGTASKTEENPETGEEVTRFYQSAKWLQTFNLDCLDDSEATTKKPAESIAEGQQHEPIAAVEQFITSQKAQITTGSAEAFYYPKGDRVVVPELSAFSSAESYYATLIHELSHWTGHPSRLDRDQSGKFGSPSYALEELVAELSAAFCGDRLGIITDLEHHASYLDHWLERLRSDKKAFFKAASQARKAADLLLSNAGLQANSPEAIAA
ncbi:zincin-like metallopeptidase domain-containing protein (plasmid) [Synechococcus elongatus PCC 11801]|uniref:Zincin-like metallopeptidase domain-containing protein n=1 Tax=Synechococcus elongatus PCC 11801 TaxID=2219813 RepID=A0ACD5A5Z6_SYNEL